MPLPAAPLFIAASNGIGLITLLIGVAMYWSINELQHLSGMLKSWVAPFIAVSMSAHTLAPTLATISSNRSINKKAICFVASASFLFMFSLVLCSLGGFYESFHFEISATYAVLGVANFAVAFATSSELTKKRMVVLCTICVVSLGVQIGGILLKRSTLLSEREHDIVIAITEVVLLSLSMTAYTVTGVFLVFYDRLPEIVQKSLRQTMRSSIPAFAAPNPPQSTESFELHEINGEDDYMQAIPLHM